MGTLRLVQGAGDGRLTQEPRLGMPLAGLTVAFLCPMAQTMLAKTVRDLGGEKVHHDLTSLPIGMVRVPDFAVLSYSARRSPLRQERYLRELQAANPGLVTLCCDWTTGLAPTGLYDVTIELPAAEEAMAEAFTAAEHLLRYARLKSGPEAAARNSLFGLLAARRKVGRAKALS